MPAIHHFTAPTSRGTEPALAAELSALGAREVAEVAGAVRFAGSLSDGYRAALWSRVASRVLIDVARYPVDGPRSLYEGAAAVRWADHLSPRRTFAVDCVGRAPWLRNTHFGALKVKDALADAMRDACGMRPDVDLHSPDLRVHVYVDEREAIVSVDLSGEPLHRRGLSRQAREAPVKENLAAAALLIAGWPAAAAEGQPLVDPMCGSGTFLVEAGWIARDAAPGLRRRRWGFEGWRAHDKVAWSAVRAEAEERARAGAGRPLTLLGLDADAEAVAAARVNLAEAGLEDAALGRRMVHQASPPKGAPAGLVVTNPPYGVRLGDDEAAGEAMAALGDALRRRFLGWTAWVLAAGPGIKRLGLRTSRRIPLWNGPIECRLLCVPISDRPVARDT